MNLKASFTRTVNVAVTVSVTVKLWMVMVRLMDRMGSVPILSIKQSISIDTIITFDGDGDGDSDGTCKQA